MMSPALLPDLYSISLLVIGSNIKHFFIFLLFFSIFLFFLAECKPGIIKDCKFLILKGLTLRRQSFQKFSLQACGGFLGESFGTACKYCYSRAYGFIHIRISRAENS